MLNIINYIMAYTKLWCKKRRQNTTPHTKYRHHNFCLLYYNKLPIHANIEQTNVIIQLLSHKQDQEKHHYNLIRNKSK